MEVAARELSRRCATRRPGCASPRSSTARRRARTSASSPSCVPVDATKPRGVGARRAAAAARHRAPRPAASSCTRSPRPRRRRGRFVRVTTIHDLNYLIVPGRALRRCAASGCACSCRSPRARSHRVIADSAATRDDLVERLRVPAAKIDVVPHGLGQPAHRGAHARPPSCASGSALGRAAVVLSLSAKRPHKNLRGLLDALARIPPERRPVLVLPGYPTPHEAELRAHARRARGRRRRALPRLDERRRRRGPVRARARVRVPVVLRGLRPAGAGGDGARRPGRVLGPRVAARGRRRRGAAVRSRRSRRRSPRRSSGCSATRRRPSGCAPRAGRGRRGSPGRRRPG